MHSQATKMAFKQLKSKKLTRRQRNVLINKLLTEVNARTKKHWTMTEIGLMIGISRQRVHQLARGYESN